MLYQQHRKSQHLHQWTKYNFASDDVKLTFFDNAVPVVNCITLHFEGGDGQIFINIDSNIVDVIISNLFFDPADGKEKLKSATCIFTRPANADEDNCYAVHIKQMKLFKLVIKYVALGASFHLASCQVAIAREQLGLGYLDRCNEVNVSSFIQVALAANMQKFKELLAN
eukprot:8382217-Ditylum_brightwellii.AAC.1